MSHAILPGAMLLLPQASHMVLYQSLFHCKVAYDELARSTGDIMDVSHLTKGPYQRHQHANRLQEQRSIGGCVGLQGPPPVLHQVQMVDENIDVKHNKQPAPASTGK